MKMIQCTGTMTRDTQTQLVKILFNVLVMPNSVGSFYNHNKLHVIGIYLKWDWSQKLYRWKFWKLKMISISGPGIWDLNLKYRNFSDDMELISTLFSLDVSIFLSFSNKATYYWWFLEISCNKPTCRTRIQGTSTPENHRRLKRESRDPMLWAHNGVTWMFALQHE